MRIEDISVANPYIAIFTDIGKPIYLPPGEKDAKLVLPSSLTDKFTELCYYDFNRAIEINAVTGRVRPHYPNEAWKQTSDTIDMMDEMQHDRLTGKVWSLYKGLEGVIEKRNFPIFFPEILTIYNGISILDYLANDPVYADQIINTLSRWHNITKQMKSQITIGKPTRPNELCSYTITAPSPDVEAKIQNRRNRVSEVFK